MQAVYNTFSPFGRPADDKPAEALLEKSGKDGKVRQVSQQYEGATVVSAASNLWNTILGGGISLLALPTAAQNGGLVVFPILIIVCGCFATYSADLLVLGCQRTDTMGYNSFMGASLGKWWTYIADTLQFFFLLGTNASLCEGMVTAVSPLLGNVPILICSAIAVIVSLVMSLILPHLDAMAPFSQAAFWLCLVFIFYVIVESSVELSKLTQIPHVPYWPSSVMGFFNAVSQVTYSWVLHFNVVPIYHEMREPKREGWIFALPMAITASAACFLLAGMFSLLTYPTSGASIFVQYSGSVFGKLLSFLFGLTFVFSMPLYQWVGARSALSLCSICTTTNGQAADTENLIEANGNAAVRQKSTSLRIMHFVWAALTFLFVALVKNLDNVITMISAIAAVPIMVFLPPLAWAYIGPEDTDRGIIHSVPFAWAMFIVGIILWVGCVYSLSSLTW
jgi:amino acid permease